MSAHRHLTHADGRVRVTRWRGRSDTAYLVVARGQLGPGAIADLLEELRVAGYAAAVTAALAPAEQAPFLRAGFEVHERLHLLSRPVTVPGGTAKDEVPLRRGRRADRAALLALDAAAFLPFWHLDEEGLTDALAATPSARLRVAARPLGDGDEHIAGYAITGRAGARGYLQRLAVDPSLHRRGIGSALVADSLRWLKRWGAREVLVNTQVGNDGALALYEALGFRREPEGLAVLRRDVGVPRG